MPDTTLNSLSVIIPTFNRRDLLAKALAGYIGQSSPRILHEILVVDDGSTDDTESAVREIADKAPFKIRYLRQENKGPAAARNFGIREARSRVVLFTDSDIIPDRDLVAQHIAWHNQHPESSSAVLGYVTWSPELKSTPFMRWYGEEKLFGFKELRNKRRASFHSLYTCNVSLKTEFLRTCGLFDESFRTAAFEDTDLGYRLSKQGLVLHYNEKAIAYHYQVFSFADACRKTRANAGAAQLFFRKEAGQQLLKEIREKQARPGYRISRRIATGMGGVLSPLKGVVDSSIPLPGVLYHLLFWYDATRLVPISSEQDRPLS